MLEKTEQSFPPPVEAVETEPMSPEEARVVLEGELGFDPNMPIDQAEDRINSGIYTVLQKLRERPKLRRALEVALLTFFTLKGAEALAQSHPDSEKTPASDQPALVAGGDKPPASEAKTAPDSLKVEKKPDFDLKWMLNDALQLRYVREARITGLPFEEYSKASDELLKTSADKIKKELKQIAAEYSFVDNESQAKTLKFLVERGIVAAENPDSLEQWKETIKNLTEADQHRVGFINGFIGETIKTPEDYSRALKDAAFITSEKIFDFATMVIKNLGRLSLPWSAEDLRILTEKYPAKALEIMKMDNTSVTPDTVKEAIK